VMTGSLRNEDTYASTRTRMELLAEGWCDPGERAATLFIADRVRGGHLLDVGIGTGRTTSLLRLLSSNYVGIDYVAEMVEIARRRHPGVDLRHADARDLSEFGENSFDLVSFSYNGLDSVGHEDRQRVLQGFHRALRPGGCLMFSTLNADGAAPRERPWRHNPAVPWQLGSLQPSASSPLRKALRTIVNLARSPGDPLRELLNWFRIQRSGERGEDWVVGPMAAHRFGLAVHFTTLAGIRRELAEHHFKVDCIVSSDTGEALPDDASSSTDWWYHVIATPITA
jgi:ubiquinone/menaquinone biosynthesis C-methylase UbiE